MKEEYRKNVQSMVEDTSFYFYNFYKKSFCISKMALQLSLIREISVKNYKFDHFGHSDYSTVNKLRSHLIIHVASDKIKWI